MCVCVIRSRRDVLCSHGGITELDEFLGHRAEPDRAVYLAACEARRCRISPLPSAEWRRVRQENSPPDSVAVVLVLLIVQ